MNLRRGKRARILLALGVLLLSFCLWLVPSDVVELIARQRRVLLGRYSMDWFSTLFLLTPILWLVAYALWASTRLGAKPAAFRVVALLSSVLLATLAIDLIGRFAREPRYIEEHVQERAHWPGERVHDVVRHRPPQVCYEIHYTDTPPYPRSYPEAPPGYPPVEITLTTDARGYRNSTSYVHYDIVTVGDSFTEGSRVSDHESWPVLLGKQLNRRVYNLGISGGSPDYYVNVFRAFGLDLEPKVTIFMIYEGNDFKGVRLEEGSTIPAKPLGRRIRDAVKDSPVVLALKKAFIKYLCPINADGPVRGAEILSWMPVAVPQGPDAKYYAFKPKRLTRLYWTENDFRQSFGWTSTVKLYKMIKEICDREKIRLIFTYAPSKPHVVMPLVKDRVTPEQLHAFASFKKSGLPPPEQFKEELYNRLDSQERVLHEFCHAEGIEFVSTTAALQNMAAQGHQVYYTYDQHWTPPGHVVVAEELSRYLKILNSERTNTRPANRSSSEKQFGWLCVE
ncbi:MAG: alginate O-acetyltransferase AlgX-related protein [Syntrophobacteria bacterium]